MRPTCECPPANDRDCQHDQPRTGASSRCRRAVWRVWRAVCARDADAGPRRADGRVREGPAGSGSFRPSSTTCSQNYVGRPSPLYFAQRLTEQCGGAQIWLKREDLNHTGAHKINNTLGQALLTLRMGKQRVIAETGAGQHGVATATACAHFGLRLRRLHGRGGHSPPGAERLQHEAAGGRSAAGHAAARGRCATPSTRRCATGWLRSRRRTTSSARSSGRIRFRGSSAIFSRSSAARPIEQSLEQHRPAARPGRGLRRRRQQRGRHVLSVHRRCRA